MTTTATADRLFTRRPASASRRFADAVVLVTGASSGTGAAAATLFAGEGALVVAADASPDHHVVDAIARAGGSATCVHEDLRLPDAERLLVGDVLEIHGRLDVLIHTASGPAFGGFRTDTPDLERVRPDLRAGSRIARAALPAMRRAGGGCMLFASAPSDGAEAPANRERRIDPGFVSLVRGLAARYAAAGIRVNAVHSAPDVPSAAAALAHLASSHARSLTGQILTVDALLLDGS